MAQGQWAWWAWAYLLGQVLLGGLKPLLCGELSVWGPDLSLVDEFLLPLAQLTLGLVTCGRAKGFTIPCPSVGLPQLGDATLASFGHDVVYIYIINIIDI